MFRHSSSAPSYGDAYMQEALPAVPTLIPRSAAGGYFDGGNVGGVFPPFAAASSPPSSYSSSYYNIHRSISAHSLPLPLHIQLGDNFNGGGAFFSSSSPSPHQQLSLPPMSSSPSSSCGDLYDFSSSACTVRRVFSTGDLQQGMNGSSPVPSGDGCGQDAGGGPFSQKVGRYSAEERKERVERYRLKRHQRNFTKKITYACRKSLADSRPRVKGRFARNGEAEAETDDREASDNSYDYCGYSEPSNQSTGNSRYHGQQHIKDDRVCNGAAAAAFAGVSDNGDWWWRAPGAEGPRQVGFDVDEELWATLGDMLSVNLAS
ncbi:transcription factor GHD7-like isoform X1 [Triticum dicoccoides]|uniref:transcription factor GHD7-like isoform X1 n=1 Tax=Triticum dicoccoides TaxID=85692 RepID=UPI0003D575B9|nr:transcription factor GHD7-like isoform X1 [Triticum dicoccoides]XP_044350793.1 transcription factor GHD7-like isoform X1 [Triticum aestivum]XP_044350794.1 transcription factor GHD7-like isoform X1 [Triticum aestivum]XP_044350795.1 transcription factor GHD7-like isoform X1 [Triticum aestivum]XP_044350796.1 transcription factor GHD7-like isoform X1 [Triticum aestivum]XP_044350797.1 transcription factor GHD7-like isoform X1 [Triticum aestivum]XP_044350798.1 transcription factor GHD7-like isof